MVTQYRHARRIDRIGTGTAAKDVYSFSCGEPAASTGYLMARRIDWHPLLELDIYAFCAQCEGVAGTPEYIDTAACSPTTVPTSMLANLLGITFLQHCLDFWCPTDFIMTYNGAGSWTGTAKGITFSVSCNGGTGQWDWVLTGCTSTSFSTAALLLGGPQEVDNGSCCGPCSGNIGLEMTLSEPSCGGRRMARRIDRVGSTDVYAFADCPMITEYEQNGCCERLPCTLTATIESSDCACLVGVSTTITYSPTYGRWFGSVTNPCGHGYSTLMFQLICSTTDYCDPTTASCPPTDVPGCINNNWYAGNMSMGVECDFNPPNESVLLLYRGSSCNTCDCDDAPDYTFTITNLRYCCDGLFTTISELTVRVTA